MKQRGKEASLTADQRRQHRIGVSLELRVQGHSASGAELSETTFSNDVSRGGCSFPSFYEYPVGSEMEIEIYRRNIGALAQTPFLTRGQVVRVFDGEEGTRMVGVKFIGPQFPTYSPESA
jgi:c-di-GMP-binding flagellar brake protein YcgR